MVVKICSEQLLRKQIKELGKDTDFLSTLLENLMGHAVVAADLDGNIIAYNEGARKIYGYTPEEIIGKHNIEIFFPGESVTGGKLRRIIHNLRKTGKVSCEEDKLRKNGKRFPARILFVLTRDKTGKTDGFIEIVEDLTERKRIEKRLWDSMSNFHKVVDDASDGIIVINRQGIVQYVNPAAELLFGRKSDAIKGKQFGFPITSGATTEVEIIRKPGDIVVAEMRIVETVWNDEFAHLTSLHDITERKAVEEKIRQIDKTKTEFLSNVSHELRTPLHSIGGFIKLLLRSQVPDKETRQEFLEIIDQESQYLGNIINSLLDMSQLESGRFEISKRPTPVRDTIADAVSIFKSLVRHKEITLKEEIPEDLPEIQADSGRLRQVIINLVGNAIKFSDPGGEVTVRAEERRGQELLIQVSDRGTGIPAESIPHLFKRFYRAEAKMVRGGAGLGLYISKQIIEAHGGHIWAESRAGKGSIFSFTLPLDGKGGETNGQEDSNYRRRPDSLKAC